MEAIAKRTPAATSGCVGSVFRKKIAAKEIEITPAAKAGRAQRCVGVSVDDGSIQAPVRYEPSPDSYPLIEVNRDRNFSGDHRFLSALYQKE